MPYLFPKRFRPLIAALAPICAAALVTAVCIIMCNVLLGAPVLFAIWQQGVWWVWLPLVLIGWWRWSAGLYAAVIAVMGASYVWYAHTLGIKASPEMLEGLLNTNPDEILRLASVQVVLLTFMVFVCVIALVLVLANLLKRVPAQVMVRAGTAWSIALLLGAGGWLGGATAPKTTPSDIFPDNLIQAASAYQAVQAKAATLRAHKTNLATVAPWQYQGPKDLIMIFVRGESARAQSFSLLAGVNAQTGHNTTPLLAKLPDVQAMPHVFSYRNYTAAAVPFMFTRATPEHTEPTISESSYISVFRHLGFDTWWIGSDRSNIASFASPILAIAQEAEHTVFQTEVMNRCKAVLASQSQAALDGACEQDSKSITFAKDLLSQPQDKPRMLVIETNGSHIPYSYLIPKSFEKWQPMCHQEVEGIPKCSKEQLRNEYDATVLYTDYLLADLINALKDKKVMLFYASDHGQNLGERGMYGHGYMVGDDKNSREQLNVAALAWMSPSAQAAFPQAWKGLQQHRQQYMGHDVLFHSVLGCAGVTSSLLDNSRNLCAASFVESQTLRKQFP